MNQIKKLAIDDLVERRNSIRKSNQSEIIIIQGRIDRLRNSMAEELKSGKRTRRSSLFNFTR